MNTIILGAYIKRILARRLWLLAVLSLISIQASAAPLSFTDALILAEQNTPTLAAEQAGLDAARSAAIPAGELPDPKLFAGIDNFPISGPPRFSFTEDDMTMEKIGVMQEIPNSDKRRARVAAAEADVDRARAMQAVERLRVRREAALAWITRYVVERKLTLFEELEHENQLLTDAVNTQQVAGNGQVTDVVLPRQEAALIDERRDELVRDQSAATAALRRWIGPDADQPLAGTPPDWPISREVLEHRLHQHPELVAFGPMGRMIDAEVKEAEAMKKPDWAVEFAYQHRDDTFGDMVSLQFTLDLPLFPGRRQDPQIAAKRSNRIRLDAEREATFREHVEMLESELAEYGKLDRSVQRQQETLLPLAQEKVELALSAYRAGNTDLMSVISARQELIDARLRTIDLEGQRTQAAARLYYAYGEDTP